MWNSEHKSETLCSCGAKIDPAHNIVSAGAFTTLSLASRWGAAELFCLDVLLVGIIDYGTKTIKSRPYWGQ